MFDPKKKPFGNTFQFSQRGRGIWSSGKYSEVCPYLAAFVTTQIMGCHGDGQFLTVVSNLADRVNVQQYLKLLKPFYSIMIFP